MPDLPDILLRTVLAVAAIILLTRLNGLRSFSKMSGFDFAITVATGSVLASTITSPSQTVLVGIGALASLFAVQAGISAVRARSDTFENALDNCPLLVMEDGRILEENLRRSGMTKGDLYGKLREANALDLTLVRAVVFESTGDVSVLHASGPDDTLSPELLEGVRR